MTQEEAKNYVATQVYDNNNKEVKAGNVRNSVNKAIDYTKEIEDKVATIGADVSEIDNAIIGKHISQPTELINKSIGGDGKWSNTRYCVLIDVHKFVGERITASTAVQYAFFSANDETQATFCEGCSRVDGRPAMKVIPNDAVFLYLYMGTDGSVSLPTITVTGETDGVLAEFEDVKDQVTSISEGVGELSQLQTSNKSNVVNAINELVNKEVEVDTTLTQSGKAGDAKAIGDAVTQIDQQGKSIIATLNGRSFSQPTELINGYLGSNGGYNTSETMHYVIADVSLFNGEKITAPTTVIQYGFLVNYNAPDKSDFTAEGRMSGRPNNATIPNGTKYVYLYIASSTAIPTISVTGETDGVFHDVSDVSERLSDIEESGITEIYEIEGETTTISFTKGDSIFELKENVYASSSGWNNNANYDSYILEIKSSEDKIWITKTSTSSQTIAVDLCVFNGEVGSANFVARYRKSSGNLPSESNPLSLVNGQTIVISCLRVNNFNGVYERYENKGSLTDIVHLSNTQIEDIKQMLPCTNSRYYVNKTSSTINIYARLDNGKFLCYPIGYRYKAYDGTNPSNYDTWGIENLYLYNYVGGALVRSNTLFRNGENELAIRVKNDAGNFVYVGGKAHGYETITSDDYGRHFRILIDGYSVDETANYDGWCDRVEICQESVFFVDGTNENPFATANKKWVFSNGLLELTNNVKFTKSVEISNAQFGMMCVLRHIDGLTTSPYLTRYSYGDKSLYRKRTTEDGWGDNAQIGKNEIISYGDCGLSFRMIVKEDNRLSSGTMILGTNASTYNKIYFDFVNKTAEPYATPSVGDVWKSVIEWDIRSVDDE